MCLKDHISSDSLLRKLGINNIQTLLRYNRLRWFGHVVRNDDCINSITEFEVDGQRGRGRPKKTWKDMTNEQCSQTLEAIKGRSCKQNWVEKETQNKHRAMFKKGLQDFGFFCNMYYAIIKVV